MQKVIYVGIDQTGAVDRAGQPRPLPACMIRGKKVHFFYLSNLSKREIISKSEASKKSKIFVCIDCVLGLPQSLDVSWRSTISLIKKTTAYGRKPASDFFRCLGRGAVPQRKIEILCKANSVFKEKPFQKNIQTGTFRLWKDISENEKDFWIPALQASKSVSKIPLFEGYPTLSWKVLLNSKRRTSENITSLIEESWPKLMWTQQHQQDVDKDGNLADAFVLALTMKVFLKEALSLRPQKEGSILGYKENMKEFL